MRITEANEDWLHNPHAGEMLFSEFMKPLDVDAEVLAIALHVPPTDVSAVIEGRRAMSGELDLRLSRYFRMSEGFFLRLQDRYEIVEGKRALNGELDRIVPRAA